MVTYITVGNSLSQIVTNFIGFKCKCDYCDVYLFYFLLQGALLASLLVVVVTGLGQKRQRHKIK
jgi:hypothetical protein